MLLPFLQDHRDDIDVIRRAKDSMQLLLRWRTQNALRSLIGVEDLEGYGVMRLDRDRDRFESVLTVHYIC